jgi:hypothetical protein
MNSSRVARLSEAMFAHHRRWHYQSGDIEPVVIAIKDTNIPSSRRVTGFAALGSLLNLPNL